MGAVILAINIFINSITCSHKGEEISYSDNKSSLYWCYFVHTRDFNDITMLVKKNKNTSLAEIVIVVQKL